MIPCKSNFQFRVLEWPIVHRIMSVDSVLSETAVSFEMAEQPDPECMRLPLHHSILPLLYWKSGTPAVRNVRQPDQRMSQYQAYTYSGDEALRISLIWP
jgi:hypothetical protein